MCSKVKLGKKAALLLIDIQKGFEDVQYWGGERNNPKAEINAGKILNLWRKHSLPLFHIQHCSRKPISPLFPNKRGNELCDEVAPLPGEPIIQKNVNSAFIGTNLKQQLEEQAINQIIIVGLTTEHCVSTTARMASDSGYETFVVDDATATFCKIFKGTRYSAELNHNVNLAALNDEFATVCNMKDLFLALSEDFKEEKEEEEISNVNDNKSGGGFSFNNNNNDKSGSGFSFNNNDNNNNNSGFSFNQNTFGNNNDNNNSFENSRGGFSFNNNNNDKSGSGFSFNNNNNNDKGFGFGGSFSGDEIKPEEKKKKKKEKEEVFWETKESIYYYIHPQSNAGIKVAAFDMDHTLVIPKNKKTFPKGREDWEWLYPVIPDHLKQLHNEGYKLVIFSNQGGISRGIVNAEDICWKIKDFMTSADVPLSFLLSSNDDQYRKPSRKFWEFYEEIINEKASKEKSFFCGDFAGRVENWDGKGAKKDKGCSDRKFAKNIGIAFLTPEDLFFKSNLNAEFNWGGIDPLSIPSHGPRSIKDVFHSLSQEIILFVGMPTSGKTTFAESYLTPRGYIRVGRDVNKTNGKCLSVGKEVLEEGKSVVYDYVNASVDSRVAWIKLAKEFNVPIRCFYFDTQAELCYHLNDFREKFSNGSEKHVPKVAYNTYKKHFEAPTEEEGFSEVLSINFVREHPNELHSRSFEEFTDFH